MMFCDFWRWNPSSRRCGRAFLGHLQRWADGGADAVRVAKALVQDLQRQPINAEHIQDVEALAALRHPGIREDLRKLVDGWEQRLRDRKRNSTEYAQIRRARSAIFALLDEALERS